MGTAVGLALTQLNALRTAASAAERAAQRAATAFARNPSAANNLAMTQAMGAYSLAAGQASKAMTGLGIAALGAGITIAGAFGVGVLKDWISSATQMQLVMAGVQSITQATGAQMQQLSATAMTASISTMFSAADIMGIAQTAVKAGIFDPALLNQMLPTLSIGAEIGYRLQGSSPAATTSAAIQIAHMEGVYGTGAPGSGNAPSDFKNMLALASAASPVSGLSPAAFENMLKYVIPIGKQLGMSIKDEMSLAAVFANVGGAGGRGASGIQTGLVRLIPAVMNLSARSNKHDVALAQIAKAAGAPGGVNAFFPKGQFLGANGNFLAVFKLLMDGLAKLNPEQRLHAESNLFTSAGLRAIAPFLNQATLDRYQSVEKYLTTQGTVKGQSDIQATLNDTIIGQWTNFKTTLANIGMILGGTLLPGLGMLVGWLKNAAAAVQTFTLAHPGVAKVAALFVAIGTAAALIVGPLLVIGGVLMMIAAAGITLAPAMTAAGTALAGVGAAALPWLLPVAAGIGLIVLIATHWSQLMGDLKKQWDALGGSQTMKDLGKAFSDLGAALTPLGKKFKDALGPNTKTLVDLLALSLYPVTSSVLAIAKGLTLVLNAATAIATLVAQHPWLGTVLSTGGSAFGFGGGPTIPSDPGAPPAIHPPGPGHWKTVKYRGHATQAWVPGKGGGAGGGVLWTPAEAAALRAGHGGGVVVHVGGIHLHGSDHQTQEQMATAVADKIGKIVGHTIQYGSPHSSTLSPSLHGV